LVFVNLNPRVITLIKRRGKMRKLTLSCVALLLLLSAIAEGQIVKINPIYEGDTNTNVVRVVANDKWLAIGNGSGILVQNRHDTNQKFVLWLDAGTDWGQGTENLIINNDILIVGGIGPWIHKNGLLGVWDLNNLVQKKIKRPTHPNYNPEGLYIPQNWTVRDYGLRYVFLNETHNLIGIYSDESGLISVYEMFGSASPVQDIFVGDDITSLAFDENFFAIGNGETVRLFRFKEELNLYEQTGTYQWDKPIPEHGYSNITFKFSGSDGLGLTVVADRLYLVIQTNVGPLETIEIGLSNLKTLRRSIIDTTSQTGTGIPKSVDGEFAVLGNKIFHIPSANIIGEFPKPAEHNVKEACLSDFGSRIELVTAESPYSIAQGTLSIYNEPVFTVSLPKKNKGGVVKLLTSTDVSAPYAKVFKGGAASFVVTADPGKKVRMIKEVGKSKKFTKKDKGSLVYKIKDIQSDTGIDKVRFGKANMPKYDVYTPYLHVIGYPIPEGEPIRWWTTFTPGEWVAPWNFSYAKIVVKPNGKAKIVYGVKF